MGLSIMIQKWGSRGHLSRQRRKLGERSAKINVQSALDSELTSLLFGLYFAESMQVKRLEIATDSPEVINLIYNDNETYANIISTAVQGN